MVRAALPAANPGVAHKCPQRHCTILDTSDALEGEEKDNQDEAVIGACDSDKEEETGEASGNDTTDVSDSDVVVLTEEEKIAMRKSHGKCDSIREGWRVLPKDEAIARMQALGTKKSSRPWKLCSPLGCGRHAGRPPKASRPGRSGQLSYSRALRRPSGQGGSSLLRVGYEAAFPKRRSGQVPRTPASEGCEEATGRWLLWMPQVPVAAAAAAR
jgi:hypothetical protein